MTKKLVTIILFALFSAGITAQNAGIKFFHGTWEEAISKAKAENKLIFIDFYTNGAVLQMMADEVFITRAVGDFTTQTL